MAIYVFECPSCGEVEEVQMPMSKRKSKLKCKKCGKFMVQIPTSSSFHLKGNGWYVTDYKNKDTK